MAGFKRNPDTFTSRDEFSRFAKLSKAQWAEAYADLYRQVFGEDSETAAILTDAEHRTELLTNVRAAETARIVGYTVTVNGRRNGEAVAVNYEETPRKVHDAIDAAVAHAQAAGIVVHSASAEPIKR